MNERIILTDECIDNSPNDVMSHQKDIRNLQIIDLFAGVGGLSLGAVRAGFHLALAVENDKEAMSAHQKNFPGFEHLEEDVTNLDGQSLLKFASLDLGELDGLVGGPPCQGFSVIGKRKAVDIRNNLFVKFFELVAQSRPKFYVAENVLGIFDEKYKTILDSAFQKVCGDYVLLEPMRLNASDFGAPTNRTRAFFIGYLPESVSKLTTNDFFNKKVNTPITVEQALKGLPTKIRSNWLVEQQSWRQVSSSPNSPYWSSISGRIPNGVGDDEAVRRYREEGLASGCFGTRHSSSVKERYKRLKPGEQDAISKSIRLKLDGFCPTLRAGTGADKGSYQAVRPIHPTAPRVITPREAARLQGFPDWYRFAPTKWHSFRQIGNSVSPILAEAIFSVIKDKLLFEKEVINNE